MAQPRLVDARPDQCRWPVSEPTANMRVCGDPVLIGHSYCPTHKAASLSVWQPRVSAASDNTVARVKPRPEGDSPDEPKPLDFQTAAE